MTSRRDFIKFGAAATASSLFVPRDLFAAYEKEAEAVGNDVVLRCCIMSDVHFDGNPKAKEVERFRRAIDFTYRYSADQPYKNFDALLVVGDMSNHGIESELTLFKKEMDAAIKPGTDTFLCMGNHEFYGGNQEYWQSVFGVEPNRRYERNGFRFIAISPEKGTMQDGDYLYMVDFLDRELADAYKADPEKPIFVFQHYPVSPTVYGGRGFDDWGAEDFFDTLQKYPTVVNFSGHTHYKRYYSSLGIPEHIHAAVCGQWWWSNVEGDGAPNGYTVYHISGTSFTDEFFLGMNTHMNTRDYQMRIYRGNLTNGGKNAMFKWPHEASRLMINVFNGDSRWTVKVYENGTLGGTATPVSYKRQTYSSVTAGTTYTVDAESSNDWWAVGYHIGVLGRGVKNESYYTSMFHMYSYTLRNPDATVRVEATDPYGNTYSYSEVISTDSYYPAYMKFGNAN